MMVLESEQRGRSNFVTPEFYSFVRVRIFGTCDYKLNTPNLGKLSQMDEVPLTTTFSILDDYKVTQVTVPPTFSELNRYRDIRLEAIATDPACFLSTHEKESSLSEDQWRERLDSDEKATFTARVVSDEYEKDGRWVGMVTVLGPPTLRQSMSQFPEEMTSREKEVAIYMIVGMWTHPEHREKGLGRRLVGACLEWVQRRRDNNGVKEEAGSVAWVVLQISGDNVTARKLYEGMGFVGVKDKNGVPVSVLRDGFQEFWMKRVL